MNSLSDLLLPLGGLLAGLVLVSALALRFVPWRGKRLYQHVVHWWVVRRGTRRMLRRAERVHAGGELVEKPGRPTRGPQPTGPRAEAAQPAELPQPAAWSQQPETVILPARDRGRARRACGRRAGGRDRARCGSGNGRRTFSRTTRRRGLRIPDVHGRRRPGGARRVETTGPDYPARLARTGGRGPGMCA